MKPRTFKKPKRSGLAEKIPPSSLRSPSRVSGSSPTAACCDSQNAKISKAQISGNTAATFFSSLFSDVWPGDIVCAATLKHGQVQGTLGFALRLPVGCPSSPSSPHLSDVFRAADGAHRAAGFSTIVSVRFLTLLPTKRAHTKCTEPVKPTVKKSKFPERTFKIKGAD